MQPLVSTSIGRTVLKPFLGKARYQRFFQRLHEVSLAGLNIGEGNHPGLSGERFVLGYLSQKLMNRPPALTLFDVGAHVGDYSNSLLQTFGDRAAVWSFEPATATFKTLEQNIAGRGNVTAFNLGFGSSDGTSTLYSPV